MQIIYIQLVGCVILVISSIAFGILLKKKVSKDLTEVITIISHLIALITYLVPLIMILVRGKITQYDMILGIPLLGFQSSLKMFGIVMILLGSCFVIISVSSLMVYGKGLPGLMLSQELASVNIYAHTRNPMSLGFYLICTAIGLLVSSTFFIFWSVIVIIPAHICFLKFFEERELELRFGQAYMEYKKRVPFLIPNFRSIVRSRKNKNDI